MNVHTKTQIINDAAGHPAFAVIPYAEYLELVEAQHDDNLTVPHEVVAASIDGDSMIKAWREYLGLTQQELADRMGISQPSFAKLERPDANPRKSTLKKIAAALGISLAQLDV
jgi:ribosome-binding protein aMBF1 (putative translation factor)